MTAISKTSPKYFLGAQIPNVKVLSKKIDELITRINLFLTTPGTVNTDSITEYTSGKGVTISNQRFPVIAGTAYASPTVLTVAQSGSTCLLNAAAGNVFTLPPATVANIGIYFKFKQTATVTSNYAIIQGNTSADLFVAGSSIFQTKAATDGVLYSPNGSSNYQIKCNGTTTGGIIGDSYEVICTGLNTWQVNGTQSASGTVSSPFAG